MKRDRASTVNPPRRRGWPEPCCTLDIDGRNEERLVAMFKALGNPIRFQILKFLLTHPGCITGDIVDALPIAQATVSQHLKVMREAGWIVGTTEGPATCYELSRESVAWFRDKVGEIF
jgi:predicted transcriptional regulator